MTGPRCPCRGDAAPGWPAVASRRARLVAIAMDCRTLLLAAVAAFSAPAAAGGSLSAVETSWGLGVELQALERSLVVDSTASTDAADAGGSAGGLYAYAQRGAAFRAEARLLGGGLDYDAEGLRESSESVSYGELRATWGAGFAGRTRVYAGVGIEQLQGDSPFGKGDGTMQTVYLPFGLAQAGAYAPGWRALVTLEGRYLADGVDEIDDIPAIGDAEFDRAGGWGAELSVLFRSPAAGVAIEPYLSYMAPAASETETVDGDDVRIRDIEHVAGGVRVTWSR